MKNLIKLFLPVADIALAPLFFLSAHLLKLIRIAGVQRMTLSKRILLTVGVFPIRDHYYEPLFNEAHIRYPLSDDRNLPGIDWNVKEQLEILDKFQFNEELRDIPITAKDDLTFSIDNVPFGPGDAEYLYNLIRLKKPAKIFEIGSGHSTLMAIRAVIKNEGEVSGCKCKHVCIEPYEMPWLEKSGVTVIRQKLEDVGKEMFAELDENDILFIDSSHVIRPQGDVLFEYLELLPSLARGVIVHIHDIFSPKDYPDTWIKEEVRFWNEQYLLEAFLTSNRDWRIIGALNYLHHNHFEKLKLKCPYLLQEGEPGSFYMQKIA